MGRNPFADSRRSAGKKASMKMRVGEANSADAVQWRIGRRSGALQGSGSPYLGEAVAAEIT